MAVSFLSDLMPMVTRRKWLMKLMKAEFENDDDDDDSDDSDDKSDDVDADDFDGDDFNDDFDDDDGSHDEDYSAMDHLKYLSESFDDAEDLLGHYWYRKYGQGDSDETSSSDESSDSEDGDKHSREDTSRERIYDDDLDDELEDFDRETSEIDNSDGDEEASVGDLFGTEAVIRFPINNATTGRGGACTNDPGTVEGNKTTVHSISYVQPEERPDDSLPQSNRPVFVRTMTSADNDVGGNADDGYKTDGELM
nr:hypothetical protein BaRGS_007501 [Batillaria attramentaria]